MKHVSCLSVTAASLLAANTWAGTMGNIPEKNWGWVTTINVGPFWAQGGKTQTFYLAPQLEKTYVARKSTNALAAGELFAGIQRTLPNLWSGQLGLALATTSNAKLQGILWDDAKPESDNYSYQYKVQHSRVTVKGKLLMDNGYRLTPWLSGSLGVGFNRAHDFTNTSLIFEVLPNSNFKDHTTTAFSYTLGAGVQKQLSRHWYVGIGYEFTDWGKNQLGLASEQLLNSGIKLNHLYMNGVLFNLTYLA